MFLGEIHGFGPKLLPEFARERNIVTAESEPLDEKRLQPRILLTVLRVSEQGTKILAHIALAFTRHLFIDESSQ